MKSLDGDFLSMRGQAHRLRQSAVDLGKEAVV